jgi:hypothetical protein
MKTVFLRVLDVADKATTLLESIHDRGQAGGRLFVVEPKSFSSVPRSPFAYWVSEKLRRLFVSAELLGGTPRLVASTNPLNDDFRYVRSTWEVAPAGVGRSWIPWAKGGAYSPMFYDINTLIGWNRDRLTYSGFLGTENRPLERPASVQHFFRPGLTWPRRTQGGLSLRAMPTGCIFADKGPATFVERDDPDELLALLAITNSQAFKAMVDMQMAFGSYEVGVLQRTPVPSVTNESRRGLAKLAHRAWSLRRSLDTSEEASHAFHLPSLLTVSGASAALRAAALSDTMRATKAELLAIQAEIDGRCFDLYGLEEDDRRAITEGFRVNSREDCSSREEDNGRDEVDENEKDGPIAADAATLGQDLVSWAASVAFGRFDIRLATGVRSPHIEPRPFDPLPACSPGMLTGDDGLPLVPPPPHYPLALPESGALVDDQGFAQDLTAAVRAVFDAVFGPDADHWWTDIAEALDPKDHDLRNWLARGFFEHHLKAHSKSRRKAPIVWQLSIPSSRYSVWLYAHRLKRDSFLHLQNEVVGPKVSHEERKLTTLVQDAGASPTPSQRKEIAAQESFVEELRTMLDEGKRVAPLWNPNLDDGVVLTMAPLWRLVPQHKAWQKELKSKWEELIAGEYDWAHIAMHLWPERVVPKCAKDRSLAIAHGLEGEFWIEGADGKWQPRPKSVRSVEELVSERSKPAVKAALKSLLEAPTAGGAQRRGRKGKSDA